MAGKKGKSVPLRGNLNAAKNVLSALARLQRGKSLPPELNRITVMGAALRWLFWYPNGTLDVSYSDP